MQMANNTNPLSIHPLPHLMVAPNGARKNKTDHAALPMTIAETVATARACYEAGADGIHAHVRDDAGKHSLDAGRYRCLMRALNAAVPGMTVQITTEAVGLYTTEQQIQLIRDVMPRCFSMATRELLAGADLKSAGQFIRWVLQNHMALQHIVYDLEDMHKLADIYTHNQINPQGIQLLFVLGRYSANMQSNPEDLAPFLSCLGQKGWDADWAICAFGLHETRCLLKAHQAGGKIRVGFENNLYNDDGSLAQDNAQRVKAVVQAIAVV